MTKKSNIYFVFGSLVALVAVFFALIFLVLGPNANFHGETASVNSARDDSGQGGQKAGPLNAYGDPLITPSRNIYQLLYRESDPVRGTAAAPVVIMEFGDYQCVYCRGTNAILNQVLAEYAGQVKLIWKDFPSPMHQEAKGAAMAARCAGDQGFFWPYHDLLFKYQADLSRELYNKIALETGLELAVFNRCLDGMEKADLVGQGLLDGQRIGVDGTPYIFIGQTIFDYAPGVDDLRRAIEEELSR